MVIKKIWLSLGEVAISGKGIPESFKIDYAKETVQARFDPSSREIRAIASGSNLRIEKGGTYPFDFTCRLSNGTGILQETSGRSLEELEIPAQYPSDNAQAWYEIPVPAQKIVLGSSTFTPQEQFEGIPVKLVAPEKDPENGSISIRKGGAVKSSSDLNGKLLKIKLIIPVSKRITYLPGDPPDYNMHILYNNETQMYYLSLKVAFEKRASSNSQEGILLSGNFQVLQEQPLYSGNHL